MNVPFNALAVQDAALQDELLAAVRRVAERGWYVLGEEGRAFEVELAAYCGTALAAGCGTGTDAIRLALEALGVGADDEVVTVAHTALYTSLAISALGARPVWCDVEPATLTMDPAALERAITPRTAAILPVHLYGQSADLDAILAIAHRRGIPVVEDCAQSIGARYRGRPTGSFGVLAALSFYPTKNLGAWGDGGAVLTNDPALDARVRRMRNGGQSDRYRHEALGVNSRLDELQAAVLRVKLAHLEAATAERRRLARRYDELLKGVATPHVAEGRDHVYHLYVVRHPQRDTLARLLADAGIGTLVHYPIPAHLQPAYASLGIGLGSLPETERAAREVLSLPLYPGLTAAQQDAVIDAVNASAALHA